MPAADTLQSMGLIPPGPSTDKTLVQMWLRLSMVHREPLVPLPLRRGLS
jgi:hypothetical protein